MGPYCRTLDATKVLHRWSEIDRKSQKYLSSSGTESTPWAGDSVRPKLVKVRYYCISLSKVRLGDSYLVPNKAFITEGSPRQGNGLDGVTKHALDQATQSY